MDSTPGASIWTEVAPDPKTHIVISYIDDELHDAWITDDPARERMYVQPTERIAVGTWEELAS